MPVRPCGVRRERCADGTLLSGEIRGVKVLHSRWSTTATMKTAFPSFDLFRYRGRFTEGTEGVASFWAPASA